jgi:hypothetical protein
MDFASQPVARRGVENRDEEEAEAGRHQKKIEHG